MHIQPFLKALISPNKNVTSLLGAYTSSIKYVLFASHTTKNKIRINKHVKKCSVTGDTKVLQHISSVGGSGLVNSLWCWS